MAMLEPIGIMGLAEGDEEAYEEAYEEGIHAVDLEAVDMVDEMNTADLCHPRMHLDQCLLRDTTGLDLHHQG